MKSLRSLPEFLVTSFKSLLKSEPLEESGAEPQRGKGQSLLRLHEYQHRVILEVFKISIAGFFAFTLILLGFALFALADPFAPKWLASIIAVLGLVLLVVLYRTVQEFRSYRQNYEGITARLRTRIMQQGEHSPAAQAVPARGLESHLLSTLKPKEYTGWDQKSCRNCHKTIEMMAKVCQHCGQEQDSVLGN
jgi:hypothetical protein